MERWGTEGFEGFRDLRVVIVCIVRESICGVENVDQERVFMRA